MTEQPKLNLSIENLARLNPSERRRLSPSRGYVPALWRVLTTPPDDEGPETPVFAARLMKLIELTIAYESVEAADAFIDGLAETAPPDLLFDAQCARARISKDFGRLLSLQTARLEAAPNDPATIYEFANANFLAGHGDAGVDLLFKRFGDFTEMNRRFRATVVKLMMEANLGRELVDAHPDLMAEFPYMKWCFELDTPSAPMVRAYCVSLERDWRRMRTSRRFLSEGVDLQVVPGVNGAALPAAVRAAMGAADDVTTGEVGCSLSHLKCWERIGAECGPEEYALVMEDDSRFLYGAARGVDRMIVAARDKGAGLVFVNIRSDQIAPFPESADEITVGRLTEDYLGGGNAVARSNPGWGTDGYLIKGSAAKELAENFPKFGVVGAIDWQMFLMSFASVDDTNDIRTYRRARKRLRPLMSEHSYRIDSHLCNLPIIHSRDYGYSSINRET